MSCYIIAGENHKALIELENFGIMLLKLSFLFTTILYDVLPPHVNHLYVLLFFLDLDILL